MFKKVLVSAWLLVVCGGGQAALAAAEIPEFNALCWQAQQCYETRAQLINKTGYDQLSAEDKKKAEEGFVAREGVCVGGSGKTAWGKCLPGSVTKTMVAFGGKRTFLNIGDFIQTNYTLALAVAGILATVMIIVAGVQWVTSGGNAESISSAKHRIGGALVGLFIAYSSYVILNTINPALVNMRLPQTWLVRPQAMVPQFCTGAPEKTRFDDAAPYTDQTSPLPATGKYDYELTKDDLKKDRFYCGNRFVMKDAGDATCFGNVCSEGTACVANTDAATLAKQKYVCRKGQLFLHFRIVAVKEFISNLVGSGDVESSDWLDEDAFALYAVCKASPSGALRIGDNDTWGNEDNEFTEVTKKQDIFTQYSVIFGSVNTAYNRFDWECQNNEELAGFFLTAEMGVNWNPVNDARMVIGYKNGAVIHGLWGSDVKIADYLPLPTLTGSGITGVIDLSDTMITALVKNKGTYPKN